MTAAERQDAIQKIESLPGQIDALIAGHADSDLDKNYRAGSWTARQVIHHLADAHMHAFIRTHFILTQDQPAIQPYDQDVWAKLPDARTGPVEPSLAVLRGMHARWTAFFRALPDDAFARTGFHPERGTVSLDDLLKLYAGHGLKHLEHIRTAIRP